MSEDELVYTSPGTFTLRERFSLALVPPIAALSFKSLMSTTRMSVRRGELWDDFVDTKKGVIVAFFHESLALAAWRHRNTGFHTLTSYSYDGELAARMVHLFGLKALRGSSSKGGMKALSQLQIALQLNEPVGWTVDGPRGPRRKVKSGIAILAAKTQAPILLNAYAVQRAWRIASWDRFPVPVPLTRIICAYGTPVPPPVSVTGDAIENTRLQVQEELTGLYRSLEEELNADPKIDDRQSV